MSRGMRMLAALAAALLLIAVGAPGVATGGELTCDGEAPAAAPASAQAGETDGDCLYTLLDAGGRQLTQRAGRIYEGDEYIAADDGWYRVRSVDDGAQTAVAEYLGKAGDDVEAFGALAAARGDGADGADGGKKLIAMYSTHSDESYLRGDGAASKW